MGKIYNDVDQSGEPNVNPIEDNLLTVGSFIEGRKNIKFRDNEINRLYNIMDKSEMRSVMIVGDYGCGKRSIIEGYVYKLEKNLSFSRVIEMSFDDVLKKVQSSGNDFGSVIREILNTCIENDNHDVVLVLNSFGHLLNLNCYGNAGFSFINNLIRVIEESRLKIIVTCTNDDYKNIEDNFKKVLDYFTIIKPSSLSVEQTIEILNDELNFYENIYDMKFPENVSELICINADKYIKDRPFPLKAEMLFDEVCAGVSNKYRPTDSRMVDISETVSKLKLDLQDAYEKNDYKTCEEINKKISKNINKFNKIGNEEYPTAEVTESDILEAIGEIVGVKMSRLTKDQVTFLREMPDELKKSVIGQDDAIDTIVKNIRRNQLGLRKTSHSAGNFMFIGSTGVGKTYLAKQLAKYLYGSENNLLRLDMSEFQAEIDVSKLLGSAPGYVGYKESGLLVKGLAKNSDTVVLFDEIEKAHPKIYDVLLQLLDEGFVTGSDGKKVDATKALIIFTSNIGVKQAQEMSNPLGFSKDASMVKDDRKEKIIRKALKSRFSPEFLNRLDNVCYFNSLDRETLTSILHKELDETNNMVKSIIEKTIVLSPEVENWIIDKVEKEDNGARPIIRVLQQNIEETVSDMVINEDKVLDSKKKTLTAKLVDNKIILK